MFYSTPYNGFSRTGDRFRHSGITYDENKYTAHELSIQNIDPPELLGESMDKSDLQRQVESYRHQLNIDRQPISKSATELRRFTESQQDQDPLVNPVDKRVNPWAEKSKCDIL